jgi:hypothetical protein
MRAAAERELAEYPNCRVVAGRAEATALPDASLDLVTAAQAMHWFEPAATRKEFSRIIKPGGWLAMVRNKGTDLALAKALEGEFRKESFPPQNDTAGLMVGKSQPRSYYFHQGKHHKLDFPFHNRIGWEEFMGSHASASSAPDEGTPAYARMERAARRVFERFSTGGRIAIHGVTELWVGRIASEVHGT